MHKKGHKLKTSPLLKNPQIPHLHRAYLLGAPYSFSVTVCTSVTSDDHIQSRVLNVTHPLAVTLL